MGKEFLMGNEAMALGAMAAGVNLVAGYPGTPSTEVLETVAKCKDEHIYVEWSTNEKAALELAAGASYSGARTLVTMKQVGLNVASDPLMSLAYIGVKGGMVIMVADDPGPISSQTEQDTRSFAAFSKLPVFDPTSVQEAYEMMIEAFAYSEKYETPVLFRPTTRICHAYASIEVVNKEDYQINEPEGFIKDKKWVIFPKLSYENHRKIEKRNENIKQVFSEYNRNQVYYAEEKSKRKGIVTHGISFSYVMESLKKVEKVPVLKVVTPFPFPEKLAVTFLEGLDQVLCIEELDSVLERELTYVCGKYHLKTEILGKLTGHVKTAGENIRNDVTATVKQYLGISEGETAAVIKASSIGAEVLQEKSAPAALATETPQLPIRPPVLCAGCPHRASFYAVKEAMKGKKAVFCGDIGCYTLGNAMPLDMVDTCLCMGAGINIAQGIGRVTPETECFAFVGDSTFFASAITGIINAKYNQANLTVVILDNSTTAMTGHQPHPGTGHTMMGQIVEVIDIQKVLEGIGVDIIKTVNPLQLQDTIQTIKEVTGHAGVKALICKAPCVAMIRQKKPVIIDTETCINCKRCIQTLGCPGIIMEDNQVKIDSALCIGCGLCTQVCPVNAMKGGCGNE